MSSSVLFVCLGNICCSPLAHAVLRHKLERAGLAVRVDSCGTSSYHAGEPSNPMSVRTAARHGIDMSDLRSRQLTRRDLQDFDLIVAMDASNRRGIERLGPSRGRVVMMRDYDPQGGGDVPDPWGGGAGGFDLVYAIVDRCCDALVEELQSSSTTSQ